MKAELNDESWLTMYAHCLKHITSDCYGLLLGAQLDHDFEITHVVPLTHSRITLPSLELAFQIVHPHYIYIYIYKIKIIYVGCGIRV